MSENVVAITKDIEAKYPTEPPFHPDTAYPEYAFGSEAVRSARNDAYRLVRDTLKELALDSENFGKAEWNPMGDIIKPGHTVVIKPNLVQDRHYRGGDIDCLITHGSIVRAVMDYVFKALEGRGRIVLGDAPVLSTRFEGAMRMAQLDKVVEFYRDKAEPKLELFDFRTVAGDLDERFHVTQWLDTPGDPSGNVAFKLDADSLLAPVGHLSHLFRLPHYRIGDTDPYHASQEHTYVVPKAVMDADVIINLPKMKTHCKAGVTGALKNFVGIVALRHCYANYRYGSPDKGGDEYPKAYLIKRISEGIERMIDGNQTPIIRPFLSFGYRVSERLRRMMGVDGIYEGRWYGNDTAWRAILDLVRIARYGRPDGEMDEKPQRTIFTLIDGIISGEDEGPLEAQAKHTGCILAGLNPVAMDIIMATLMHYDFRKISTLREGTQLPKWPLLKVKPEEIRGRFSDQDHSIDDLLKLNICEPFVPARGWIGYIEADAP